MLVAISDQLILSDVPTGKELRRITLPRGPLPKTLSLMGNPAAAYEGLAPEYKAMMQERVSDQPKMDPKTLERLKEMSHWVRTIALHPNGNLVAIGNSHEVSLWDLQTGKLVRMIGGVTARPASPQQELPA